MIRIPIKAGTLLILAFIILVELIAIGFLFTSLVR